MTTIFLLSPADCGGRRAATLFQPASDFELSRRMREPGGAPLGEVFSYVSGLYFRGKLTYAERFSRAESGAVEPLVITGGWGLRPSSTPVTLDDLHAFSEVPIELDNPRYCEPLRRDVEALASSLPAEARVVLLGSIATPKYVQLLLAVLGARLWFPRDFIGLGDMSRGAILLRAARDGVELEYMAAAEGVPRTRSAGTTRRQG